MNAFLDRFNTYSENRFLYLRLSAVNVFLKSKIAEFCLVVPESKFEDATKAENDIKLAIEKAIDIALKVKVKIKKSHFDTQFFTRDLIKFFDYYASFKGCISKRNVEHDYDADRLTHRVFITLKESAHEMFVIRGMMRELNDFVESNYCEKIEITVLKSEEIENITEDEEIFSFEAEGGRFIRVSNVDGLIGHAIYDLASYICDADRSCESIVLCGKIGALKEIVRKKNNQVTKQDTGVKESFIGENSDKTKNFDTDLQKNDQSIAKKTENNKPNFFKFQLSDGTGLINCVYFAGEKTIDKFRLLKEGSEIIAMGKLEANSYEGGVLNFYIKRLSTCTLPDDFKINRLKFNIPKNYKNIFPKKYEEFAQTDIFSLNNLSDASKIALPQSLIKNEFVVFDIETTGLDRLNDKIIEIGAVKIKNGVLVETFSCFVDPEVIIPERITKLTGISNSDVKDAYLLREVLPDLYKFFGDCIILGHNSEYFDYPFLAHAANNEKIFFDNKRLDTYTLAKEYLNLEQYRLKDLAAHFEIINDSAHRALSDAITTAEVFVEMCKRIDIKI